MRSERLLAVAMLALTNSVFAQAPAPQAGSLAPPISDVMAIGSVTANQSGVKGQPYSYLAKTTTVRVLADGTTIRTEKEERHARDSEGRTRLERITITGGESHTRSVFLSDPEAHTATTITEQTKQARVLHLAPRKPMTPEQQAHLAETHQQFEAEYLEKYPGLSSKKTTVEKLDTQNIQGLLAEGTRITTVTPVGVEGNDHELRRVTETWTSPEFKLVLLRTTDDPRSGKTTYEVTDFTRADPDPALFQIPSGYKIVDSKGQLVVNLE